jgi:hypothetical protein
MSESPNQSAGEDVPGGSLEGNETGASSDGDSGPQGAKNDPKPGNQPETGDESGEDA